MLEGGVIASTGPSSGRLVASPYPAIVHGTTAWSSTSAGVSFSNTNAPAGKFECEGPRQIGHRALSYRIGKITRLWDDLMDARAVDDRAASASLDKVRDRLLRTKDGAGQVHVEDPAIGFDIERLARRLLLNAGIVDQTVEARPACQHRFEHVCDLRLDADIGANDAMVAAAMPPLRRGRLDACKRFLGAGPRAYEIDGDGCTFLGQPNGDRPPDALSRAGHQRVLPDQTRRNWS